MGQDSYIPSTSPNATDVLGVYYNGTNYFWSVGVSGSTGESITINNYGDGRLLTATNAADQIDAESTAKYTLGNGLVVVNSGSFITQLHTGKDGTGDFIIGQSASLDPSEVDENGIRLHINSGSGFFFDFQNGLTGSSANDLKYRQYNPVDGGIHDRFNFQLGQGKFIASGDVVAYGSPSDISLKENVQTINNALEKIKQLRGVSFDWKEKPGGILDIKEDLGFIAQEVQQILPQLVRENENGELSLRLSSIIPVLVEAIKDQQKQIDELKSKL